jgi:hypothetical protein
MKKRTDGFLAPDQIDHDHEYLWELVGREKRAARITIGVDVKKDAED